MASKEREKSRLRGFVASIINRSESTQPHHSFERNRKVSVAADLREINYTDSNVDWISELAHVFGNPVEVQQKSDDPDSDQEVAVYEISLVEDSLLHTKDDTVILTVTRDLFSRAPHFKLDVRHAKFDRQCKPYHSLISKIQIDLNAQWACFSPPIADNGTVLRGTVESHDIRVFSSGRIEHID
ncbi:hypothetical protein HYS03_02475 [Candidatus Woesebacteria bacterium]|nr:hypothetical protein [Candidatus Woesebacteria bacterium]QQG47128.1 MAG: hypothetical protein HY044_03220 [Candidatus Woesebacteria bacterium]